MKHNRHLDNCAPPCDYEGARVSTPLGVLSLHTHIQGLPKTSKMREAITPEPL